MVHLAAEIASQRDAKKVREVNVAGTERLLDACRALGDPAAGGADGPRFVFSSTVVTGDAHGELLTEDAPLPVETPYGRAKQEGERMVLESGLPAVVVRPSHVYGPGGWYAEELVPRLRQPGRFAVIGSGANLWDVVHVRRRGGRADPARPLPAHLPGRSTTSPTTSRSRSTTSWR